jgi:ABC-type bacteriocin/lantibiotic exporter with double-glycine peptidase domain
MSALHLLNKLTIHLLIIYLLVNYRYPGNDKDTLSDINLKMTLSSRVVLIGANGAGKSSTMLPFFGCRQ